MAIELGKEYGTPVRESPVPVVLYNETGQPHDILTNGLNAGFYTVVSNGSPVYVRIGKDGDRAYGIKKITIKSANSVAYTVTGEYFIDGWGIGDIGWDPAENSNLVIASGDAQRAIVWELDELISYTPFQLKIEPGASTTFYVQIIEG